MADKFLSSVLGFARPVEGASVTRFWACPVMQVRSATYFPYILNLPQVEVIGDIRNIFPDINTIDNEVGPYMPPRDERFPVWQTTDRSYTMWVTPDGGGIGNPTLVLYGDAPGASPVAYGAWMFGTGLSGLDSVLGLLEYQSVSMARLTWYLAVKAFVALSDYLVEDAEFHGPLFLDASFGGGGTADYGKASLYSDTGELIASATEGYAIQGRVWSGNPSHGAVYAEGSGASMGITASSSSGYGANFSSASGIGMRVIAAGGIVPIAMFQDTWNYTKKFSVMRTTDLKWEFLTNNRVLQLRPPTAPTANRNWDLPDKNGTLAVTTSETFTNTILAGTTTATGQVELTSQLATNGTSAMTRNLADEQYIMQLGNVRRLDPGDAANSLTNGGGGAGFIGTAWVAAANTPAAAWSRITIGRNLTSFSSYSGANINTAKNYDISLVFCSDIAGVGPCCRFVVGDTGSGTPPNSTAAPIAGRGWGFEVYMTGGSSKIRLFVHDGTTFAYSAPASDFAMDGTMPLFAMLRKQGGTVSLFIVNNAAIVPLPTSPQITLAGAPTSGLTVGSNVSIISTNDGTNLASRNSISLFPDVRVRIY